MNRTDRLIAIVLLLHSRKLIRAKEIAKHFGIAIRTVYRDMKSLNEAGVPIAAESGEGYSLVEGYHLPPVMFTQEEAGALYLGSELTKKFTDASLKEHIDSAISKVRAILPSDRKEYLERLSEATAIHSPPMRFKEGFRDDVLTTVQDSIVQRNVLSMEYYSTRRDSFTQRKIEPLGLVYYANFWHMIAYCRLRQDFRDFRTDRIKSIVKLDEVFEERPEFSLTEYIRRDSEIANAVEVKIKFKPPVASYVRDRYYFGLVSQELVPDGVVMTFMVPDVRFLVGWLLSYGDNVEMVQPVELNILLYQEAQRLLRWYEERAAISGGAKDL